MEYNMSWFAAPGPAPYLLATDINDVMLSNVLDAPMLSDTPRSVSLMGAGGGGAGDQTAPPDLAATVPQEFAEWSYQEYSGYDPELKHDEMELEQEEEIGPSGDGKRKPTHNAKKPKVHLDPKLKLKGPITYEKDVDPSLIPIVRDGMARCEKCGALGVRHAFYTRERRYCSLSCARSGEGLPTDDSAPGTPEEAPGSQPPPESPLSGTDGSGGRADDAGADMDGNGSVGGGGGGGGGGITPRIDAAHGTYSWDGIMQRPTASGGQFSGAPVQSFLHAPLASSWENVCVGLKVEVTCEPPAAGGDPSCWVGTVLRVEGYRGLVRYEGLAPEESAGRWMDLASDEVHPVGWCATQGRPLIPPPSVASRHADWGQLLVKRLTGARTLPANHHHRVVRALSSSVREEQVVEVVDKNCISQVRAACVKQVVGRRLHVRYLDAPEDDGGFWCHENSSLVHPVGWAAAVGHRISAPPDYLLRCQTAKFLPQDVTEEWSPPLPPAATPDSFLVGMKLEALDPLNLSSIGVATVQQVLGAGYLMVRLETQPSDPSHPGRDWFCYHSSSPYIFPARFCQQAGIPLTPPAGYAAETFCWEAYLADTGAPAAPGHLFQRPPLQHRFKPGQFLEAVDLMDPALVCVATVVAVAGRLLRVHFTGWETQFDQWVDVESPDIFPVGWCRMVGYKLEPPRAGERQAGKARARRRAGKKMVGRRPRPSGGRAPPPPRLPSTGSGGSVAADEPSASPAALVPDLSSSLTSGGEGEASPPAELASEPPSAPLIPRLLDPSPAPCADLDPGSWSVADVSEFLRVNECAAYCESFTAAGIDGQRLLTITKDQVLELACWKVGPSLKIENLVQKLRARVAPAQARFMASFKKV